MRFVRRGTLCCTVAQLSVGSGCALAAPLLGQAELLAARFLGLAHLAAALLVGFGLAGGRRIDPCRHDLHRKRGDGDGGVRDRADDATGQGISGRTRTKAGFINRKFADIQAITIASRSRRALRPRSAALVGFGAGRQRSRPMMISTGTAIGVIRSSSTWSMVAAARSRGGRGGRGRSSSRRASSQAARSSRCRARSGSARRR